MGEINFDNRQGFIRIGAEFWQIHSEAVKKCLSDGIFIEQRPWPQPSKFVGLMIKHPELDICKDPEAYPLYSCGMWPNEDGTVRRGPFVRLRE